MDDTTDSPSPQSAPAACSAVYYFGCIGRAGHYLWHPVEGEIRNFKRQPWGDHIDGGIFGASKNKYKAGVVHSDKRDGWTAVAWADYSVDSRPASHSTFLIHADVAPEALIEMARQQWPKVFDRRGFPSLLNAEVSSEPGK